MTNFEIGVGRDFGIFDLDRSVLVSGWADPEDGHNWNDGCEAVLSMLIADPGQCCTIEFMGEPFLRGHCLRQDIVLHVNGFHVGFWRLTDTGPRTLLAHIEPEQLFRRGEAVLLRCAWSFPNGTSPAALGISDDTRQLAFCFRSIIITAA